MTPTDEPELKLADIPGMSLDPGGSWELRARNGALILYTWPRSQTATYWNGLAHTISKRNFDDETALAVWIMGAILTGELVP